MTLSKVDGETVHLGATVEERQKVALSKLAEYRRFHGDGEESMSKYVREALREWLARRELPEEVEEKVAEEVTGEETASADSASRTVECRHCRQEFDKRGVTSHQPQCWAKDPPPWFRYDEDAEQWEKRTCGDCEVPIPFDADRDDVEHRFGCRHRDGPEI